MSDRTALPVVADLASDPLVHRFGDLFAPPGLTNFLGVLQADNDLVGVRSITFPPFGSLGDTITARAFIDGRLLASYGAPVTFQWRPDRITRTASVDGLDITTTTAMAVDAMGFVVDIEIANAGSEAREVPVRLGLSASVTKAVRPWGASEPPGEKDNAVDVDAAHARLVFSARDSAAVSVQGVDDPAAVATARGVETVARIEPGQTWRVGYVHVVGGTADEARSTYDALVADVPGVITAAEREWDAELAAVFTPGNDRFGGALPWLETDNAALRRLYAMGALGVVYFRRDSAHSVMGRTYDTLMPRYWQSVTFLWDYNLSSLVHALLDPGVMRRHLEHWIATDVHTHFGTEWLTGSPVGNWYAVNDFAMTRMIRDYVSWTGDVDWLTTPVAGGDGVKTVADYVHDYATAWRSLRSPHGLADYGGIDNLLECVSTYIHSVASLNAANAFTLRTAAAMDAALGETSRSAGYADEAAGIATAVNELYADGEGWFHARYPDGSLVPVRHCYDFFTVPFGMLDDLSETQRQEMADFFVRELQSPTWMHALSPYDDDALFSVRPDHQWNGAYPAWPSESAAALWRMGHGDVAAAWLPGLARSTNQGPLGQAHFVETAVEPDTGGARKAPNEWPWINDWTCSSTGSWVSLVIEAIFGVKVGFDGALSAAPQLADVDPTARLRGLVIRGTTYDVDAAGLHPQQDPPDTAANPST